MGSVLHQTGQDMRAGVKALRGLVVEHIRENRDEYAPYMMSMAGEMMTDAEFEEYCQRMENTTAWGGQLELAALTAVLKRPIHVYNSRDTIVMGEDYTTDGVAPISDQHCEDDDHDDDHDDE